MQVDERVGLRVNRTMTFGESAAFLTDRYQLTMLAAYGKSGHAGRRAVFELFARRLPPSRRYLIACGIGRALSVLTRLRFGPQEMARLDADRVLGPALKDPKVRRVFEEFRFRGRVMAIPEGHICFPHEPLVRVEATLAEAQLAETILLSIVNHDVRVASKCARIVSVAQGHACFEFGTRRVHEQAAVDAARSAYVTGFVGTSNEEAGARYGVPVLGTMAHAFVLAHAADSGEDGEGPAFADFGSTFEGPTTCLVDTFDPLRGVARAADALGEKLAGIRLDSGDLGALARSARSILDSKGLTKAQIVLSDDLDEHRIAALLEAGAPVDAFGVGTMAVATPDAPTLGAVYKIVALEDADGRMMAVQKRAPGKGSSAAPKQVFRTIDGRIEDEIALATELPKDGYFPLLVEHMSEGEPTRAVSLDHAREICRNDLLRIEGTSLAHITPRSEEEGFPVTMTSALRSLHAEVEREGRVALT